MNHAPVHENSRFYRENTFRITIGRKFLYQNNYEILLYSFFIFTLFTSTVQRTHIHNKYIYSIPPSLHRGGSSVSGFFSHSPPPRALRRQGSGRRYHLLQAQGLSSGSTQGPFSGSHPSGTVGQACPGPESPRSIPSSLLLPPGRGTVDLPANRPCFLSGGGGGGTAADDESDPHDDDARDDVAASHPDDSARSGIGEGMTERGTWNWRWEWYVPPPWPALALLGLAANISGVGGVMLT